MLQYVTLLENAITVELTTYSTQQRTEYRMLKYFMDLRRGGTDVHVAGSTVNSTQSHSREI